VLLLIVGVVVIAITVAAVYMTRTSDTARAATLLETTLESLPPRIEAKVCDAYERGGYGFIELRASQQVESADIIPGWTVYRALSREEVLDVTEKAYSDFCAVD